jgi:ABC-type amino acid transport substrate-binding protein
MTPELEKQLDEQYDATMALLKQTIKPLFAAADKREQIIAQLPEGWVDQFTNVRPTANDWRTEDAELDPNGTILYVSFTIHKDCEEILAALDTENNSIEFV